MWTFCSVSPLKAISLLICNPTSWLNVNCEDDCWLNATYWSNAQTTQRCVLDFPPPHRKTLAICACKKLNWTITNLAVGAIAGPHIGHCIGKRTVQCNNNNHSTTFWNVLSAKQASKQAIKKFPSSYSSRSSATVATSSALIAAEHGNNLGAIIIRRAPKAFDLPWWRWRFKLTSSRDRNRSVSQQSTFRGRLCVVCFSTVSSTSLLPLSSVAFNVSLCVCECDYVRCCVRGVIVDRANSVRAY